MPILIVAVLVIIIDQITKYYIQTHMFPGMSVPVVKEIFHITYVLNPGAAFGILENQTVFFVVIAVGMVVAVLYMYPRIPVQFKLLRIGIGIMAGGAVGNVIDRIKTGYVVDFFDFRVWPVFNIADIAIVSGVCCILYSMIFLSQKEDDTDE